MVVLYSVVVPQTLRHMRGMTDKPGKSKGKRKPAASKGPTKAELKVRGHTSLVVTLVSLCLFVLTGTFTNSFKLHVQSIQVYNFYSSHA